VLSACLPLSACNDATAPAQSEQEIGLVLDVDKSATETDGRDYDIYDRQQGRRYQYRGAGHEFTVTPNGGTPKTFVVEASFEGDLLSMLEDLSGGVASLNGVEDFVASGGFAQDDCDASANRCSEHAPMYESGSSSAPPDGVGRTGIDASVHPLIFRRVGVIPGTPGFPPLRPSGIAKLMSAPCAWLATAIAQQQYQLMTSTGFFKSMTDAFRDEIGVTPTAGQLVLKKPSVIGALGSMVQDVAEGLKGRTALSISTVLWNSNPECNGKVIVVNSINNGFLGGLFGGGGLGGGSGGASGSASFGGLGGGSVSLQCSNETWQMSKDGGATWESFSVPTCRWISVE
jgi:hypothetical protein